MICPKCDYCMWQLRQHWQHRHWHWHWPWRWWQQRRYSSAKTFTTLRQETRHGLRPTLLLHILHQGGSSQSITVIVFGLFWGGGDRRTFYFRTEYKNNLYLVCPTRVQSRSAFPKIVHAHVVYLAWTDSMPKTTHLVCRRDHLVCALQVDPQLETVPAFFARRHLGVYGALALQAGEAGPANNKYVRRQQQTRINTSLVYRTVLMARTNVCITACGIPNWYYSPRLYV